MKKSQQDIINYYQNTATGAYDRWGGETGGYHFGYYDDPNIDVSGKQPEDIQKLHHKSHLDMLKLITSFVNPKPGEVIVDAGCGAGSMLPYLSKAGARVIGVNITPEHILKAQDRIQRLGLKNVKLLQCDYAKIPLANNSIDKIIYIESLTHATDKKTILKEADRLLKPGGEIIIIENMLIQDTASLNAKILNKIKEIEKGMSLKVTYCPSLISSLISLGYSTKTKDITTHVLPSMKIAVASAEAHHGEDIPKDVVNHRLATIFYGELTQLGILKYKMLKAVKQR